MKKLLYILPLFAMIIIIACTPKATEETTKTEEVKKEAPKKEDDVKTDCATFKDAPSEDDATENYVIYRDMMKAKDYGTAMDYWQNVYKVAPAADGKRRTLFEDGIKLYHDLFTKAESEDDKKSHVNTVMGLYDKMEECYGEPGYIAGRKAFDYYYKYSAYGEDEKAAYNLFKKAVDITGKETKAFVVNPFTASIRSLYLNDKISMEEAQTYVNKILSILEYGPENSDDKASWEIVQGYAPELLSSLEGKKGFYDCAYYSKRYYYLFEENPTDCEVIGKVYGYMKWGGCELSDEQFAKVKAAFDANCRPKVTATTTKTKGPTCRSFVIEGDYTQAVSCYEEKMNKSTDPNKKAEYALFLAKLNYGQLKNYVKARQYARQAAELKPNWGEPYVLIGKLYASSGPLCGSGRGFMSQRVVWVAIDKWQYAKKIDPNSADEAQKLINQYYKYMPDIEDLFSRSLTEGQSYTVDCWINERTTVRAKK
ncbi:MAG: hypothetical protein AAGK97_04385 [Bacteroidota bacterium]